MMKSLIYALFFGIGALGKVGGEPGFMLPAPVLPAAIVSLTEHEGYVFLNNALYPDGFWTVAFFSFYCVRLAVRKLRKSKRLADNQISRAND